MRTDKRLMPRLDRQTAAYKLFHWPYLWRFVENEMFDENDTEFFGRSTTGNAEWDMKLATAKGEHYVPVAVAAGIAGRGVSVELVDPKDACVIYPIICQHLDDWLHHIEGRGEFGRARDVPLEGLKELNALAKGLVLVGRRFGLVELDDPFEANRRRRAMSMGYVPKVNLANVHHDDTLMNRITAHARKINRRHDD